MMPSPRTESPTSTGLNQPSALTAGEFGHLIGGTTITRSDLAFTHSIFVQCFLPMRALPEPNNQYWEVSHGGANRGRTPGRPADAGPLGGPGSACGRQGAAVVRLH
jgi:hypothetical protein